MEKDATMIKLRMIMLLSLDFKVIFIVITPKVVHFFGKNV